MEEMPGEEMAMEEGPVMGQTYHLIHLCHLTRRQATGFDLELCLEAHAWKQSAVDQNGVGEGCTRVGNQGWTEWVEEERQGQPEGGKVPRKH